MDDETLLQRYAREGDETAFRTLAQRYGGLVYAACLRDVRRPDLAEDAAQGVFLVLARKAGRIRVRTTLVPWLVATSRLISRGVLRAERRHPSVPLDETVVSPDAASDVGLFQALDALSAPDREAVVLRFVQGLSLAEVGQAQGISEDAARMRVQRALKRLRTEYVPALAAPTGLTARLAVLPLPKPVPLMTTPLLLTAGSLVLATGAVANAFRHTAAPSSFTSPSLPSAQAVPPAQSPLGPANSKPEKAEAPLPTIPTLDRPFTLVYRMTSRNVRTKAMMDALIADRAKELAKRVDADEMTQAQMDKAIAEMSKPPVPTTKRMTLSYDGKRFLFEEPDYAFTNTGGGRGTVRNVNLFDGRFSYHFFPGAKNWDSQGDRYLGTVSHYTSDMPYVGPALPLFPLTQGSGIFVARAWEDKLHYTPGTIERGPGGSVAQLKIGYDLALADEIVLKDFTTLQGRSIARSIVITEREYEAPFAGVPKMRMEYTLVSASPEPLPAERFVPDSYLADGDDFTFVSSPNMGGLVAPKIKFNRAKGTLEEQIAAQGGNPR